MPTIAESVYANTIKPLSREAQKEIASLIQEALSRDTASQDSETAITYDILLPKGRDIYFRSPRVVRADGSLPPVTMI